MKNYHKTILILLVIIINPINYAAQINFVNSNQNLGNTRSFEIATGDFDGDGDIDAFVVDFVSSSKIWLNDGSGNYSYSSQSINVTPSLGHGAGIEDLDGDNDLDIFLANGSGFSKVYFNDGTGIFTDSGQNLGTTNVGHGDVKLKDIDGDNDLDALFVSWGEPNELWLNDGHGIFLLRLATKRRKEIPCPLKL